MTLSIDKVNDLAASLPMDFDPDVLEEMRLRSQAFHDAWASEGIEQPEDASPAEKETHARQVGSLVSKLTANLYY